MALRIKKQHWHVILSSLLVVSLLVGTIVFTYSKYVERTSRGSATSLESFEISGRIRVLGDDGTERIVPFEDDGTVELTMEEFKNFQFIMQYKGEGRGYIRFKLLEEWVDDEHVDRYNRAVVIPTEHSQFIVDENVFDNRVNPADRPVKSPYLDNYYYYTLPLECEVDGAGEPIPIEITLLDGLKTNPVGGQGHIAGEPAINDVTGSAKYVRVSFEISVVQYNRYKELWEISEFPWIVN